jgi:hypothetical protein
MSDHSSEQIGFMNDRAEIIEVCCRMHWYLDRKMWDRYRQVFTDEVSLPSREEFGALQPGEATRGQVRPLAEFTANIQELMDGLTTQHIVSGHHVDLRGDSATCFANGLSMHIGPPSIAENRVMHANAYEFELKRTPDGWRIAALNSQPIWAQGNELVAENRSRRTAGA